MPLLKISHVIVFLWMWYGKIDIVVKAQGMVRPVKKEGVVINPRGGKIKEVYYSVGDFVKKGALLYRLDSRLPEERKRNLYRELNMLKKEIVGLQVLYDVMMGGSSGERLLNYDIEYYNRYNLYKLEEEELKRALKENR